MSEPYWEPLAAAAPATYVLPDRLGTVCQSITDWNNAKDNGWYMAAGAANAPSASVWYYGEVIQHNSSWVTQRLRAFAGDYRTYVRHLYSGTWTAWIPEAGEFQTGSFNTGNMANDTQYGWNVYFPYVFKSAPRAVVCTLENWSVNVRVHLAAAAVVADHFDLYVYNYNNNNNCWVRWLALQ